MRDSAYQPGTSPDLGQGICYDLRDDTMYPDLDRPADVRAAKALCAGCPTRTACLQHALALDERWGIWGGLTEDERAAMHERVNAGAVPADAFVAPAEVPPVPDRATGFTADPAHPELLKLPGLTVADDGAVTLTDAAWAVVYEALRGWLEASYRAAGGHGRRWPSPSHRRHIAGVIYKLGHGVAWRRVPASYGKGDTLKHLYTRLVERDVWTAIVTGLHELDAQVAA